MSIPCPLGHRMTLSCMPLGLLGSFFLPWQLLHLPFLVYPRGRWSGLCSMPHDSAISSAEAWASHSFETTAGCRQWTYSDLYDTSGLFFCSTTTVSPGLFNHLRPVKRTGKHFGKEWFEWKVLVTEVAELYGTYQKYTKFGGHSSYQSREIGLDLTPKKLQTYKQLFLEKLEVFCDLDFWDLQPFI